MVAGEGGGLAARVAAFVGWFKVEDGAEGDVDAFEEGLRAAEPPGSM